MKECIERAVKTFFEAAVSFLVADAAVIGEAIKDWDTGKHAIVTLGVGAFAAGISAVWNILTKKLGEKQIKGD